MSPILNFVKNFLPFGVDTQVTSTNTQGDHRPAGKDKVYRPHLTKPVQRQAASYSKKIETPIACRKSETIILSHKNKAFSSKKAVDQSPKQELPRSNNNQFQQTSDKAELDSFLGKLNNIPEGRNNMEHHMDLKLRFNNLYGTKQVSKTNDAQYEKGIDKILFAILDRSNDIEELILNEAIKTKEYITSTSSLGDYLKAASELLPKNAHDAFNEILDSKFSIIRKSLKCEYSKIEGEDKDKIISYKIPANLNLANIGNIILVKSNDNTKILCFSRDLGVRLMSPEDTKSLMESLEYIFSGYSLK